SLRIDPQRAISDGYDVRSDIWSLVITIVNCFKAK
ncbi:unnamed protein product, partial [Rotaria sp. Silwood1]